MLDPTGINWLAVLIAAVAHQAVGFVWYGLVFAKTWQDATGRTDAEIRASGGATQALVIGSIAALVMAAAFALLLTLAPDRTITTGIIWGAVLGIGFVATTTVINGAYEARKPVVTALFAAYETVALIVMGAILTALR
jgi:hypothetical protein